MKLENATDTDTALNAVAEMSSKIANMLACEVSDYDLRKGTQMAFEAMLKDTEEAEKE